MAKFRNILRATLSLALALIFIPVVGEFFIKLAEEHGVYQHPSARVSEIVGWIVGLTNTGWFWLLLPLVAGLTLGMWLDALLNSFVKRGKNSLDGDWFSAKDAFGRFSDSMHKVAYSDAVLRTQQAMQKNEEADDIYHKALMVAMREFLNVKGALPATSTPRVQDLAQKVSAAKDLYEKSLFAQELCYKEMIEELEKNLARGELIAKGVNKLTPGVQEIIPEFQWTFLLLDIEKGEANSDNLNYVGVFIRKP